MAVELRSLPVEIQKHIQEIKKVTAINKIFAHDCPSGNVEFTVVGTDDRGRNFCKIFSEVLA